jgi:hypothetical protein
VLIHRDLLQFQFQRIRFQISFFTLKIIVCRILVFCGKIMPNVLALQRVWD